MLYMELMEDKLQYWIKSPNGQFWIKVAEALTEAHNTSMHSLHPEAVRVKD